MSAVEDQTIAYYQSLGYGYSQAVSLTNADLAKQEAARLEAQATNKEAAAGAESANKSFIEGLTSKLTELISSSNTQLAETSQKQVQAVIDAAAGNGSLSTANAAYRTPDTAQPGSSAAPGGSKTTLYVMAAIAGVFALVYFWKRR